MAKILFKDGDAAIMVRHPQWNGARSYRRVEIGKVHKTGRLTLKGEKQQWVCQRGWGDEPNFFVATKGPNYERLYPVCADMIAEIDAEQQAQKDLSQINRVGDALSRMRDRDDAVALWSILPKEVKDLVSDA